ncbi:135_t:CDS:10 [Ambispora gerdemannii]|uniref:135_t:CDS:1 n=1 Tax=Ambispora gerdemannii TaxID=144530 RepID=A0A9N9BTK7_9GLOM|nr:135_t:CDS:10 [Ambispora gerdemannii]
MSVSTFTSRPSSKMTSLNSATSFIEFLKTLKYPNASELLPEQLLWATEQPSTRVLLDWLCQFVDPDKNVVNKEEEDSTILKQIESLEVQLDPLTKHHDYLLSQKNQLKLKLNGLEKELENFQKVNLDLDDKNRELNKNIEQDSIKLDLNMADTINVVKEIVMDRKIQNGKGILDNYQVKLIQNLLLMVIELGKIRRNYIFQCSNALKEFLEYDQSFTKELEQHCQSLYLPCQQDLSNGVDLIDEITRLKSMYPITERKFTKAALEHERLLAYLNILQNEIPRIDAYNPDFEILRSKHQQNLKLIEFVDEQVKGILLRIEEYLSILAEIQIQNPIFIADNQRKSVLQMTINKNLEHVVDLLLSQYARLQLLNQAENIEFENQKTVHQLLIHNKDELQTRLESTRKRMTWMSTLNSDESAIKTVVASDDDLLLTLKDLVSLDKSESKRASYSLFTSYDSLKEEIRHIEQRKQSAVLHLEEELRAQQDFVDNCAQISQNMTAILYNNSPTSELILAPIALSDLQISLRRKTNRIQPRLGQIAKEITNNEQIKKRKEMFKLFYTDPARFRQHM